MPYVNLRDFGALGDGAADDTKAFCSALRAAAQGDGTLYVPAGTYRIQPVRIPSSVTILGHASWGYSAWGYENNKVKEERPTDPQINGHTVFVPASAQGEALWDLGEASHVRIAGISLDGQMLGNGFHGILARGGQKAQDLTLEDARICHFTGNGLTLDRVQGFALRRSLIIRNLGHAMEVSGSRQGSVIDNQLSYNDGAGFWGLGQGTGHFTITANRIEGGGPGGIYLEDADNITVYGNSFDSCCGPSVTFLRCRIGSITGNLSRLSGRVSQGDANAHFRMEDSQGIVCAANSLWGWPALVGHDAMPWYGMVLRSLTGSVIAKNSMHDAGNRRCILDYGGHRHCLVADNQGRPHAPEEEETHADA